MYKHKVFIDGTTGTTGLRIRECLQAREDIEVINIQDAHRRHLDMRLRKIQKADLTFLCLPDVGSQEIAARLSEDDRVIDTSSAHRTNPEWVYGLAELPGQKEKIQTARLVSNPGCHATGFILLIRPFIDAGILKPDSLLSAVSFTGYSGGGKDMIADYSKSLTEKSHMGPNLYALGQTHKHLPEMTAMTGLHCAPVFMPAVCSFYSGMLVSVPLHGSILTGSPSPEEICTLYQEAYGGTPLIEVSLENTGVLRANDMSEKNGVQLFVSGSRERMTVSACYDNLGKGACANAIQNMNLMLGLDPYTGLKEEF